MESNEFSLMYEGLNDESPPSVHRFKLALIADLELDVEHAQALLQGSSHTVLSAETRAELERAFSVLQDVGARVAIVASSELKEESTPPAENSTDTISSPETPANSENLDISDDDEVVTLDLDESLLATPKSNNRKVYTLTLDEESDLEDAMTGMQSQPEVPTAAKHDETEFNIGPEPEVLNHPESATEAPDLRFDDIAIAPHEDSTPAAPPAPVKSSPSPPPVTTGLSFDSEAKTQTPAPKPPQDPPPVQVVNVAIDEPPPAAAVAPAAPPRTDTPQISERPASRPLNTVTSPAEMNPVSSPGETLADFTAPVPGARGRTSEHPPERQDSGFSKPQLVALFIVGISLLAALNWVLFAPKESKLSSSLQIEDEDTNEETEKSKPISLAPVYVGSASVGDLTISITATINKDGSILAKVNGSGGTKPQLSPEQLGGIVPAPPWLDRFDTDAWMLQSMGPTEWTGTTIGYFYIEHKDRRFRLPGTIRIRLVQVSGELTRQVEIEALLSPPDDPALPAAGALIEMVGTDRFRVYVRGSAALLPRPTDASLSIIAPGYLAAGRPTAVAVVGPR